MNSTPFGEVIETWDFNDVEGAPDANWFPSTVMWSSIGQGDIPFWLFYPGGEFGVDWDATEDHLRSAFRQNELGWTHLDRDVVVQKLLPLGDNVVAYCDEAVYLLTPTFPGSEGVASTVGVTQVLDVGIPERGAAGGTDQRHAFVDQRGQLWRFTTDGPEPLGYTEYIKPHIDEPFVISYNSYEQEFVISTTNNSWVLTSNGLAQIEESASFVESRGTEAIGVTSGSNDPSALYVGPDIDFGDSGVNTITSLALGYSGNSDVLCALDYRYGAGESYARTGFTPPNNQGIAYVRASAEAFRPVVYAEDPEGFDLDYLDIRYQLSDKRHQRGPRAN